ncbi:hypothetical protein BD560DRAFT_327035 [Blakeslea trispora]|nr:hypothetical protein BD560DRAFT_327035 [Blakeslea trispora]
MPPTWFGKYSRLHSNIVHGDQKYTNIAQSAITPAYTTTQLLLSDVSPCILSRYKSNLLMLLECNNLRKVVHSVCKEKSNSIDKPKAPRANSNSKCSHRNSTRTESHQHIRAARSNSNQLRILVIETNMIRATKIVCLLKPRRAYLSRRKDDFMWGRPSALSKQQ